MVTKPYTREERGRKIESNCTEAVAKRLRFRRDIQSKLAELSRLGIFCRVPLLERKRGAVLTARPKPGTCGLNRPKLRKAAHVSDTF